MDRRFSAYDGGEGVEERGALCQDRLSEWCGQRPVAPAHDCSEFYPRTQMEIQHLCYVWKIFIRVDVALAISLMHWETPHQTLLAKVVWS